MYSTWDDRLTVVKSGSEIWLHVLHRDAVGKIYGEEAAEQAHIHSLQGLCSLLLAHDVPFRRREAELASRQNALVDAIASPVRSSISFWRITPPSF